MNLTSRFGSVAVALTLATSVGAETLADRFRENEQKQEALAGEARQLIGGLDTMLGEYERNGLAGEDVAVVQRLKAAIAQLSTADMRQVVDLLQRARAVQDPGASTKTAADAFSAQKQIVTAIQKILAEHSRQQEAQQLAKQLNDLADRQARNLQNGIELGRLTGSAKPENFAAILQAQLETQRGEQQSIAAEITVVTDVVKRFAAKPENADLAERFRSGAKQLDQLQPRAEQAEVALKAGQLFKAVAEEKVNRDELRKISREIAPRERGPAALRQAERELAEVIREQEQLMADTGRQRADTDFARWIDERMADIDPNRTLAGEFRRMTPAQRLQSPELRAKFDAEQRAKATELAKMEDQQGELAGKADHVGQMVPEIAEASEPLKKAGAAMQEARNAMQEANAPAAQQQQADAIRQMQAAREELQRKAEEAELLAANSGDKIKDLERLRAAVENMAKQEEAISKAAQPNVGQQANIARRAAQIGPRAAELAPAAAPMIQQGAAHAENARAAMAQNQNEPARQQAAQAAQQLARAAQQIAQELAQAQQAEELRQQAEAALAELAKLIEAEQKLDLSTAKAMAEKKAGVIVALAEEQARIEKQTTTFKASLSGGMISAVSALNEAENAMEDAQVALKKPDGTAARSAEALAIARLFDAQANINRAAQAAQQALGQPFDSADAMARAANQIAQAMQEVNGAQQNLQQAAELMGQEMAQNAAQAAMEAAQAAQQAAQSAQASQQQAQQAGNQSASGSAGAAAQQAQQAAQSAQQAAQSAQQIASQNPQAAVQQAQQAAQQAGQAAQSAQQAAASAQQAQQAAQGGSPANQAAAQQAASAAQSAQQAAAAALRAQQLANAAANTAQSGQQAAGQSTQQAAGQLAQAAMQATQAAAQQAGTPAMQQAMQQAAQQLANAANQAMNGQNAQAQQAAQQAAQQLAQASGQMQAMQAGISQPSAGQMPGQGKGQGQMPGQGMQGAGRQPGQGQGSGPTAQNHGPSEGAKGYQAGGASEAVQRAARETALRNSTFLGLPPRERAAIQQSLSEKYPQEFAPLVEQYLLNLANEPAKAAGR